MHDTSHIHSAVPVIATDDIQKSITYYKDVLGFEPDYVYGDPPVFGGVKSGDVEIYFSYDPDFVKLIRDGKVHPEIFIWINDASFVFQKHINNGAAIVEDISDRPWGARQYVVRDINNYHLKFAQPL